MTPSSRTRPVSCTACGWTFTVAQQEEQQHGSSRSWYSRRFTVVTLLFVLLGLGELLLERGPLDILQETSTNILSSTQQQTTEDVDRRDQHLTTSPITTTEDSPEDTDDLKQSDDEETQTLAPNNEVVQGALSFIHEREEAYKKENQQKYWKLRGNGYLYTWQTIALAGQVISGTQEHQEVDVESRRNQIVMGRNSVVIWNVHPDAKKPFDLCHKLSIWVRVNGPEIIAGEAKPIMADDKSETTVDCFWQFEFDIAVAGDYTVDAKIAIWNGQAPLTMFSSPNITESSACRNVYVSNTISTEAHQEAPQNTSLIGFKLYSPVSGCCEECRRLPGCKYWATPPNILPKPTGVTDGCEFFFGKDVPPDHVPTSRIMPKIVEDQLKQIAKQEEEERLKEKNEQQRRSLHHLLRQGIIQPIPTIISDDRTSKRNTTNLTVSLMRSSQLRQRRNHQRRLNDLAYAWGSAESDSTEVAYFVGCGWSYQFTLEYPCLSGELDDLIFLQQTDFVVSTSEPSDLSLPLSVSTSSSQVPLPLCTQRDESMTFLDNHTEFKMTSVGRWVREPWPNNTQCPQPFAFDEEFKHSIPIPTHDGDHPHCWHREDLTPHNKKCRERNCALIEQHGYWLSAPLQLEKQFMGVWRNYQCDYLEFTNAQLSECMGKAKISQMKVNGASVADMMEHYLKLRLRNVTMYDGKHDGRTITLSSLRWPHVIWRESEEEWKTTLENQKTSSSSDFYWVTPFFASSEREPYVHLTRAMRFGRMAEKILTPKGYQMINVFDPSAAFTYDTAAQRDGLHVIGPPLKMVMTKLFHHLCADQVEGSRV